MNLMMIGMGVIAGSGLLSAASHGLTDSSFADLEMES